MSVTPRKLSDLIVQDMASRLDAGQEMPFRLNTTGIAEYYGSSRTPVRQAIEQLVRRGRLKKLPNGRLVIPLENPPVPNDSHPKLCVPADSLNSAAQFASPVLGADKKLPVPDSGLDWRARVRRQLVEEIVQLSLRGQADFLREQLWSERLGIGRGILRQLLSELAGQGLVVHVPRRGWQVRPFDAQAMFQYLEIREVLELQALELAKDHLEPEKLMEMLAGNPGGGTPALMVPDQSAPNETAIGGNPVLPVPTEFPVGLKLPVPAGLPDDLPVPIDFPRQELPVPRPLNNEIHGYLIERAGNRYISDFFQRHSAYYTQLFEMAAVQTGWRDAMAEQHRQILTALLHHDWPQAKQALAHHIRTQRPVVQDLLRQVREIN